MVGFLGRLLPCDSSGETFSGGFASFLLKGHPIPFKFPGCISKVYNSTYTYMMYLYIYICFFKNSPCIYIVYESEHWDMKEQRWCLKVYKYQNLKNNLSSSCSKLFFSSLLAYRSFPSLSQSTLTGKSLQHHALSQNHPCLHQKYALGGIPTMQS